MKTLSKSPIEFEKLESVLNNADTLCKEFDKNSDCKNYLIERIKEEASSTIYLLDNNSVIGICIINIIEKNYGNLIMHTINETDEPLFCDLLIKNNVIQNHILELIQFRSNFNYRDSFIEHGCREKERIRMIHQSLDQFENISFDNNISFENISMENLDICGEISYEAHKHRIHIENYDIYSSPEKRTKFGKSLRTNAHGKPIENASLIMNYNNEPVGIIEVTHTKNWNMTIGWIMDIALHPKYQGIGLGEKLLQKSLQELHKEGYSGAGLGVTLSNIKAKELYTKLGFFEKEFFVEIIG